MSNPTASIAPRPEPKLRLAGSTQLIERLVARHGQELFRFLIRLTNGDRERAEDIYQETLLRAWRRPEDCRQCLSAGPGWLYTIARRISIDQLRAAATRPVLVSDEIQMMKAASPSDQVDRALLVAEVRSAITALSLPHQEVLRQVYLEDRPVSEVAARLGVPVGTVKSRTHYALGALKDALAARGMDHSLALCA